MRLLIKSKYINMPIKGVRVKLLSYIKILLINPMPLKGARDLGRFEGIYKFYLILRV